MVKQSFHIFIVFILFIVVFITTTYFSVYFFVKNETDVVVPDVHGEDIVYALEIISDNALNIRVEKIEYHDTIPKNHVIYQNPKPGIEVKPGRDITVILSKGSKLEKVPDVRGERVEKANIILDSHRLCRGKITQTFHPFFENGMIIAQNPEPGSNIAHGACINLLISNGSRNLLYKMPDYFGESFENTIIALSKIDNKPVSIKYVSDAMYHENQVIDQKPEYGFAFTKDDPVNFTVNRGFKTVESIKEGMSLYTYTLPHGYLKRHILVRLNIFSITIHVYDDFYKPSDKLFVFVPNNCDASVFVYKDDELVDSQMF